MTQPSDNPRRRQAEIAQAAALAALEEATRRRAEAMAYLAARRVMATAATVAAQHRHWPAEQVLRSGVVQRQMLLEREALQARATREITRAWRQAVRLAKAHVRDDYERAGMKPPRNLKLDLDSPLRATQDALRAIDDEQATMAMALLAALLAGGVTLETPRRMGAGLASRLAAVTTVAASRAYNSTKLAVAEAHKALVPLLRLVKRWVAEPDACSVCRKLHGSIRELHEEFDHGDDSDPSVYLDLQGPPRHPSCRCVLRVTIRPLRGVGAAA